jgi:cytochrome o ubiquinol oxidase subunit II
MNAAAQSKGGSTTVRKLQRIFLRVISCGWLLLLSGCDAVVLNPKGMIAADEKKLLIDALLLMLIVVIPVIVLTLVIAFKYRASNTKAKYSPNWAHATLLEAGWWIIPIVIICVLATLTWRTTHALDPYKPLDVEGKPITIQVISLDWKWLFIYPEQNIATVNFVEFPVDTPVTFLITSDAPMNSFMIQQLAGQIYSMAGMQTQLHLIADAIGDYNGRSVSFSGDGFAGMTFVARVTSKDTFNQWVQKVKASPNSLTMKAYNQLIKPTENNPVAYYSTVTPNLFNNTIMKYMMPMASGASMAEVPSDEYKARDRSHHKTYMSPEKNDNTVKGN